MTHPATPPKAVSRRSAPAASVMACAGGLREGVASLQDAKLRVLFAGLLLVELPDDGKDANIQSAADGCRHKDGRRGVDLARQLKLAPLRRTRAGRQPKPAGIGPTTSITRPAHFR